MRTEQNVLQYIRSKQIDIALLSAGTGLSEQMFAEDVAPEWTADEFLRVCAYLEVNPWLFSERKPKEPVLKKDRKIW